MIAAIINFQQNLMRSGIKWMIVYLIFEYDMIGSYFTPGIDNQYSEIDNIWAILSDKEYFTSFMYMKR